MMSSAAFAGHPMLSEDTGTQGKGNFELELGYDWSRQAGDRNFLFQPQLSWGAAATVDLIVQPAWVHDNSAGVREQGFGDTNLDAKWRFYGAAPWSLGIRAGLGVPTAHDDLGLPHDKVSPHAILVATGDYTPFTFDANLGYGRAPADASHRGDLYHFSAAATVESAQQLFFVLDVSADSNPDITQGNSYTAVALIGVIYTVRPGFDLDVGYRGRLNATGPVQQWLLGITVRGAP
jgi:hypothetical protein